ncbi:MAG: signal peptidase II [Solirubrobacterales bacterium]
MSGQATRSWALAAALCVVVVALDQGAKALVEGQMTLGQQVGVLGPIELTLSYNSGVAFGIASGGGGLLIAFTLVSLAFVVTLFARDPTRPGMWVAVGLLVGGALGNLIDRVVSGEVTDYIDILSWPAFNLADAAITVGIAILALVYVRDE